MPRTYTKKDGTIVKYNYYVKKRDPQPPGRKPKVKTGSGLKVTLKNKINGLTREQMAELLQKVDLMIPDDPEDN